MLVIKLLLSALLSYVFWLLYGAPEMQLVGNFLIFGFTVFHLLIIIWNRQIFLIFGGDVFTYGMITLGINLGSFLWTVGGGILILNWHDGKINSIRSVPYFVWGGLTFGLIASILIQMITTKSVSPLPNRDDRRSYEAPRSD